MRRLGLVLLLLAGLLWPWPTAAREQCFESDKTPFCLADPFSDYWSANGGLPVFGYPLTAKADQANADTGQVYPTQWVERNRFEYHAENAGTPYAVLLGLLGKERLAQLDRNWQAEPRESGPQAGCLWFEQTGHNVCNQQGELGFKRYWESHGLKIDGLDSYARSLQLFGLPLTAPTMETNLAGDTVLTQWFERARFEWHPSEPDEYKVLLGLLGAEVWRTSPPPEPALPTATPIAAPTPTPAPTAPPQPGPAVDPSCSGAAGPGAPESPLRIVGLNKRAETVTLRNVSGAQVNVDGWWICSLTGNQLHAVLSGSFAAGETRTIASQTSANIWNNTKDDDAALYSAQGQLISFWND